jgi:hypothetical protein
VQKVYFLFILYLDGTGIHEMFESVTRQILYRRNYKSTKVENTSRGFFETIIAWFTNSTMKGEAAQEDAKEIEEMMN